MNFLSALIKLALREINDRYKTRALKKAQVDAYAAVGEQMKRGKRKGQRINGRKRYQTELRTRRERVLKNHKRNENFINDA